MGKGVFAALTGVVVAAITVVLLATASAPASKCGSAHARKGVKINTLVPPGNSSASEYVENVPTARGGCPSLALRGGTGAGALRRSTRRALLAHGPDGVATATLVRDTSGASNVTGLPSAGSNGLVRTRATGASGGGSSLPGAVADVLGGSSGGGGLGALLPIVLLACLLGTVAIVFVRRARRRS